MACVYHGSEVVIYLHYGFQDVLRHKHQHLGPPPVISGRRLVRVDRLLVSCHCITVATEEDIIVGAELNYDLRFLSHIYFP